MSFLGHRRDAAESGGRSVPCSGHRSEHPPGLTSGLDWKMSECTPPLSSLTHIPPTSLSFNFSSLQREGGEVGVMPKHQRSREMQGTANYTRGFHLLP